MAKSKSPYVLALDNVQAAVWDYLRPLGYRKRGRSFNRVTSGGNTLAINLQQGMYAKSKYGQLAVNLGVFIPCVYLVERGEEPPLFCSEPESHVRQRLGVLVHGGRDVWFDLSSDLEVIAETLIDYLKRVGLPFLDGFSGLKEVADHFEANGSLPGLTAARGKVVAAIVNQELGKAELAQALLRSAHETTRQHPFNSQVRWFAKKLDIPLDL